MTTHIVQSGETLGAIAQKYYGNASAYTKIAAHNNIDNPNLISVGQALEIPDVEQDPEPQAAAYQPPQGEQTSIETDQLAALLNNNDKAQEYSEAVKACLAKYQINTEQRISHFLAQVIHESGNFKFTKENLNYSAKALRAVFGKYFPDDETAEQYSRQPEAIANRVYANRMGNGDEQSGEGWAYRGRGLMQLTGKDNYQRFSAAYNVDVVNNPDQVSDDLDLCVAVAGWYWQEHKLNQYADSDDVETITRKINGGLNGLGERKEILDNAKKVFGIG